MLYIDFHRYQRVIRTVWGSSETNLGTSRSRARVIPWNRLANASIVRAFSISFVRGVSARSISIDPTVRVTVTINLITVYRNARRGRSLRVTSQRGHDFKPIEGFLSVLCASAPASNVSLSDENSAKFRERYDTRHTRKRTRARDTRMYTQTLLVTIPVPRVHARMARLDYSTKTTPIESPPFRYRFDVTEDTARSSTGFYFANRRIGDRAKTFLRRVTWDRRRYSD